MTLELWDTARQEVYRSLVGFYTREAKGAFLVCDVTSETTFEGLANKCGLEGQRVVASQKVEVTVYHYECVITVYHYECVITVYHYECVITVYHSGSVIAVPQKGGRISNRWRSVAQSRISMSRH
jgi:hypothetical protein